MAETSDRIGTLAGKYIDYDLKQLDKDAARPTQLVRDIRSMAASLLRQREPLHVRMMKVFRRA